MSTILPAEDHLSQARSSYSLGRYLESAGHYLQAENDFKDLGDEAMAAEMANNRSVALMLAGKPKEAFQACSGTDIIFSLHGDKKRQALALGNQASAAQSLGLKKQALALFQQSSGLLAELGDHETQVHVLKNISVLHFKMGQFASALVVMSAALEADPHPGIRERILKFLLGFIFPVKT
jgi:tetratricopeptide (TPR) repeat protein